MNYYTMFFTFFLMSFNGLLSGCPSCIGKIKPESPTFFSPEFYQPRQSTILRQTKEQFATTQLQEMIKSYKGKDER